MSAGVRVALRVYGLVWGVTAIGAIAGAIVGEERRAATAVSARPGFLDILSVNGRLLAALALAAVLVSVVPGWRLMLDAVVTGLVAVNALAIGAAIGATGPEIVRALLQLPLEWAAVAAAASGYVTTRRAASAWTAVASGGCGLALAVVAAAVEAWPRDLGG